MLGRAIYICQESSTEIYGNPIFSAFWSVFLDIIVHISVPYCCPNVAKKVVLKNTVFTEIRFTFMDFSPKTVVCEH